MKKKVVIIGAGMAGCFMATCLSKQGYDIELYDFRPDVRKNPYDSGRSFNLTLYYRGILAMKKADVWDEVKKIAIIAKGNAAHYGVDKVSFDPFDGHGDEILYTVHRNQLNGALLNKVEQSPNVKMIFNTRCVSVDKIKKTITLKNETTKKTSTVHADIVIGADGLHSIVRTELQKGEKASLEHDREDWGYKEVHITPKMTKTLNLQLQATHTWPRPQSLLIAFPNPDDSFTLMFNLPLAGEGSFEQLHTKESITAFITKQFPELLPLLSEIIESFLTRPTGNFVTVYTSPWYYKDFMVLIGDAAHAVIPFYGQGACAAFEDCLYLAEQLRQHNDNPQKAFEQYYANRKKNTDLLAQLSKDNFIELRDKSRSMYYTLKDKTDTLLHRLFPKLWLPPLYILVAHGTLEYTKALQLYRKQSQIAQMSGINLGLHVLALPWTISAKITNLTSK